MFEIKKAQEKERQIEKEVIERERLEEREINASAEKTREFIEEEKAYRRGVITIKDLIAPASFKINPNFLILGNMFVRTIFVINYPRYINIGWFAPIINLNSTFDGK